MGRAFRFGWWAASALVLACLALPAAAEDASAATEPIGRASDAVVGVVSVAVDDASSNATLGSVRRGSGVVIGADGLVLTIGYLILEADQVQLLTDAGRHVPARVIGYDVATGFGLVKALIPLGLTPVPLGDPARIEDDEVLLVISGGEDAGISMAQRVSQRSFSAYWEYHLDHALFTAPARTDHSGAALFNLRGELLGVGSLFVGDALGPGHAPLPGNMFVPVDLLKPILDELLSQGRSAQSKRAWMGVNCIELEGEVRVLRVSRAGPAEAAGLRPGDRILRIDGATVDSLDTLWHRLWDGGAAERDVALDIVRDGRSLRLPLRTVDRQSAIKQPLGT
ncbi:MAG TPA: S1C family serine protease [Ideonella sp.]|jgi:S1-C subfamily serine protease|nr:S1C family serine protease [Ideonella sp.]